jgi:hypothetical protein
MPSGGGAPSDAGAPSKAGTPSTGGTKNATGGQPDEGGTGGTSTSAGGDGGTAPTAGSGEGGGAGEVGASGGGGAGEGSGAGDSCADFPVTVTMGPTIGVGTTGAIICMDTCRITTNTYSDGEGACPQNAGQVRFFTDTQGENVAHRANMPDGWEWDSASAGDIDESFPNTLTGVPSDSEVTGVVISPEQVDYTVVFTFHADGTFTVTSFTES